MIFKNAKKDHNKPGEEGLVVLGWKMKQSGHELVACRLKKSQWSSLESVAGPRMLHIFSLNDPLCLLPSCDRPSFFFSLKKISHQPFLLPEVRINDNSARCGPLGQTLMDTQL